MLHIPVLRHGVPYESVEQVDILHHATGKPVARVSQANSGMVARDIKRMADDVLERFFVADLLEKCRKAGEIFMSGTLPIGDQEQTFDSYVSSLSATTGMPVSYCRTNAQKIATVLAQMDDVLSGLTRGLDFSILDRGWGESDGRMLSFFRVGRIFGAVLPSNSPGVHSLWAPALVLKTPVALKPGREEPWTPYRMIEAFCAAGFPREAFGFYPTDHGGAAELLRCTDRSMLFGDATTTAPWRSDPRVEIHGPGFSKIVFGDDTADEWEKHIDVIVDSIAANCGRSCINTSAIWTPKHGRAIADALAERLAGIEALPADDPNAAIAAFANATMAERISTMIDQGLGEDGAVDVTQAKRGRSRLATIKGCAYLLPTIIWCDHRTHTLANREFLFPFATVVECPTEQMASAIGSSLVVSAITKSQTFIRALMEAPNIDRLNVGPIPTWRISWDQPHEGNLFEHLYRQRAFQIEPAA